MEKAVTNLSPDQVKVAELIAQGLGNKDIANELGISLGVTKWHIHRILTQFKVDSRYRLILALNENRSCSRQN